MDITQLKSISGYKDQSGREVVVGDVYASVDLKELKPTFFLFMWFSELHRFGWITIERYTNWNKLPAWSKAAFPEPTPLNSIELHTMFSGDPKLYFGNIFTHPEKLQQLTAA